MKNHIIASIVLLLSLGQVFAQPGKSKNSSEQHLVTASELLTRSSYYNAIKFIEQALVQDPGKVTTVHLLADTYHKARDYANAADYYGLLIDSKDPAVFLNYPLIRLRYAEALHQNKNYNKALREYETFAKSYNGDDAATQIKKASIGAAGCKMAVAAGSDLPLVRVRAMNNNINSGYTDYAPMPVGDSMFLFSSIRSKQLIDTEYSDYLHSKIYVAEKGANNRWGKARVFNKMISGGRDHVGHGAFSPDNKRFYYTECPTLDNRQAKCKIYVSQYEDGGWKKPKSIKEINISGYKSTTPIVTRDNRGSERIYFASDRPNGLGGMDIWYIVRRKGGTYTNAENFKQINTPYNETTPYFDEASEEFYFSSNGHPGYGGYDIFVIGSLETSGIRNLGLPINSSADDAYYIKTKDPNLAYVVSNRASNLGVANRTCCDNIYDVVYGEAAEEEEPSAEPEFDGIAVSGFVYAATDISVEELENARLKLFDNSRPANPNLLDGKNSSLAKGYFFALEADKEYLIEINKDGYVKETINISTKNIKGSKTFRKDIYLLQKGVNVQGMVYSEDKRGKLNPYVGADITVSQKVDGVNKVISNFQSQSDGYKTFLPAGSAYKITATADTYLTASFEVDTRATATSGQNTKDIILRSKEKGRTFKIENIYYDTNSSELRPESYPPLNELLLLLIDNPNITIEIGAHTDSKGDPDYNKTLSLKRAESVVDYLAAAGIARDRLLAQGYGETNPVADNNSDAGRQLNRRTEFKIVDLGN